MATRFGRALKSLDLDVSFVEYRTQEIADFVERCPLIDGRLLTGIEMITGQDNDIPHGLDRVPAGYIVVNRTANSVISTSSAVNKTPKNSLILNCSANVTVSLWVF